MSENNAFKSITGHIHFYRTISASQDIFISTEPSHALIQSLLTSSPLAQIITSTFSFHVLMLHGE